MGESTLQGGQDYRHIILFFKGPMFKLQPCDYYEGFSQHFCILWEVKTQRSQNPKKLHFFISYYVMLEYICAK
jgi:hypothetical protein